MAETRTARGPALVTGASSGIGAAVSALLAQAGWRVVCAARRMDRLERLVRALGENTFPIELDIADARSVDCLLGRVPKEWGAFAAVINCAGHDVGGRRSFHEGTIAEWAHTVETNTIGTMRVVHAVVPGMLSRGGGHIVNIGSTSSRNAYAGGAAYVASKHAIDGFSKSMLADYRNKNIRVTHVMPGLTRTEFNEMRWRGDKTRADELYASFANTLDPEDVARAVMFVLDQPAHVTIAELLVLPTRT